MISPTTLNRATPVRMTPSHQYQMFAASTSSGYRPAVGRAAADGRVRVGQTSGEGSGGCSRH